jgi:homoserine acetyltransferase
MSQKYRIGFALLFAAYVLATCTSCKSIKNLSKKVDKVMTNKDSSSVSVKKDSSRFNNEIVIEYDDTAAMDKLNGADFQPFVVDVTSDPLPSVHTTQKVKRIIIRSNVQLHKIDSTSTHELTKTIEKKIDKQVAKKTKTVFPWWIGILIIAILFLVYEKYKDKIKAFIG